MMPVIFVPQPKMMCMSIFHFQYIEIIHLVLISPAS